MRVRALSPKLLCLLSAFFFTSGTAFAAEYIERNLLGNTIPAQKCAAKDEAVQKATDRYTIDKFTRRFCETQGYGWYVSEAKDQGKLVCEECSSDSGAGKYRCHVEDIAVTCKRLKPGSVGLIPGEG
jgi:hypothetical protein